MPLSAIALLSLAINLPLGYLRSRCRKLSAAWLVYVHLSVPLIAACRILSGIRYTAIPLLLGAAVAGQFLGGWARRVVP
jgi:hypothetical protein